MLTSLRKNSTLVIVALLPGVALTLKFTVEKLWMIAPLPGEMAESVGGAPTGLATLTLSTTGVVAVKELVSVTRAVIRWAPSWARVGVHWKL